MLVSVWRSLYENMGIRGYGKPISMLIHTSQKTDHHQNIAEAVRDWIVSKDVDEMIRRCEKVWNTETSQFTLENNIHNTIGRMKK